jgi:hypothetical protein
MWVAFLFLCDSCPQTDLDSSVELGSFEARSQPQYTFVYTTPGLILALYGFFYSTLRDGLDT